ncbi:11577_t:CDS:2 [Gigaspora margarita]|uniref:11577_t:CDS:1 n=1 Tax=Gigaspora margarita TaxID=4874 RepID=A0ABN7UGA2_GIGMA|nr:11577_t:CDS:2 [Gigaspora margarita]
MKSLFDSPRLMRFSYVTEDQIVYQHKECFNIYKIFHTQYTLYKKVYTHRVTRVINFMIRDALVEANPVYHFEDIINKPEEYIKLNDSILYKIEYEDRKELQKPLKKSKEIIEKIRNRKLYKFVNECFVPQDKKDQIIKKDLETLIASYRKGNNVSLNKNDIIVDWQYLNYANGEKNPVEHIKFYKKDPNKLFSLDTNGICYIFPKQYEETILCIFAHDPEKKLVKKKKVDSIQNAFQKFMKSIGLSINEGFLPDENVDFLDINLKGGSKDDKIKTPNPGAPAGKSVSETNGDNEKPKMDTGVDNGDDFDAEGFVDLKGNDIDAESQEADGKIKEEFAACFPGKGKVESVPVDIYFFGLGNLEKKLDKSFSALHTEIEEGEVLDAAWPKVRLSKPWDQHEYDFLTKIRRCLDRAIRMLSSALRKDFVDIRDEVEARATTLRLADNKGYVLVIGIIVVGRSTVKPNIKDILHLLQTQKEEIRTRKVKGRIEVVIPFVARTVMAFQTAEEQSRASIVVESGTSCLAALQQVQNQPVNQELKTDHARGEKNASSRCVRLLAPEDRTCTSGYGLVNEWGPAIPKRSLSDCSAASSEAVHIVS